MAEFGLAVICQRAAVPNRPARTLPAPGRAPHHLWAQLDPGQRDRFRHPGVLEESPETTLQANEHHRLARHRADLCGGQQPVCDRRCRRVVPAVVELWDLFFRAGLGDDEIDPQSQPGRARR